MFDFKDLILCNEETPQVRVKVWASMENGCLTISGQDFGKAVEDVWGEDEYEYFYNFDAQNTALLYTHFTGLSREPKEVFLEKFGGMNGDTDLRKFCEINGIIYKFYSC